MNYNFPKDPVAYATKLPIKTLEGIITYLKEQYYHLGKSVVSDEYYDALEAVLQKRKPNSSALTIGIKTGKDKEELPFHMGSMDKAYSEQDLTRYLKRFPCKSYLLSDKEDGVSAGIYQNGKTTLAYKRSDDKMGHNITNLLPHLKGVGVLPKGWKIRGEIIMARSVWESKWKSHYDNPRAAVVGATNPNRKEISKALADCTFLAYEIIHPRTFTPKEQFDKLVDLGFETPEYKEISKAKLTETYMGNYLAARKSESDFDIDGIIVSANVVFPVNEDGNPKESLAFKVNNLELAETVTVTNVEWNESRYGYVIPRIEIEPTKIGDVVVTYVTAHNAAYVRDNNIGVGSRLKVIRSGDVIPYIVSVEVCTTADMPEGYPDGFEWTENDAGEKVHLTSLSSSVVKKTKTIEWFFTCLGSEGIRYSTIEPLVSSGYDTLRKFLRLTPDKIRKLNLSGFGDSKIAKICNEVRRVKREELDLASLMYASSCFGRGIGYKKLQAAIDACDTDIMLMNAESLSKLDLGDKTTTLFLTGMRSFKILYYGMNHLYGITYKLNRTQSVETTSNLLQGESICFTGFRDERLSNWVVANGGIVGGFSGKTTLLVYKAGKENKKTDSFDRKMTVEDFITHYKIPLP